jgi:hypothetical protein
VLTAIAYDVAAGPGVSEADYFSYFTVLSNLFAAGDCVAVGIGIIALIAATTWAGNRRGDALA